MATPHDELFKVTFSQLEHARAELRCVLRSALSDSLDWESLSLLSGEFVGPQFAHLHSDLLFSVRLGSEQAYVYLLFEHRSSVDATMPLRLLRYMTRIWERFEKEQPGAPLPPVVPVVMANVAGPGRRVCASWWPSRCCFHTRCGCAKEHERGQIVNGQFC